MDEDELTVDQFRNLEGITRALLRFAIMELIAIIRLFELQRLTLEGCAGKLVRDDLVYRGLLFSSMEGLLVRLCNLGVWTDRFLGMVSAGRLNDFPRALGKRSNTRKVQFLGRLQDDADGQKAWHKASARHRREQWDAFYGSYFPSAIHRNAGRPSQEDISKLQQLIKREMARVEYHRDKFTAHWDRGATAPVSFSEVDAAINFLKKILGDLFLLHTLEQYLFTLGGHAARPAASAAKLVRIITGEQPSPSK